LRAESIIAKPRCITTIEVEIPIAMTKAAIATSKIVKPAQRSRSNRCDLAWRRALKFMAAKVQTRISDRGNR
jgi:hypothetical protein